MRMWGNSYARLNNSLDLDALNPIMAAYSFRTGRVCRSFLSLQHTNTALLTMVDGGNTCRSAAHCHAAQHCV